MGTFCKIGQHEHMESLQRDGTVFMNTLAYFWGVEDGGLRGDPLDGVDHMANGVHAELRTPGGELIPANVTSWSLQTRTAEPENINLFCMYAIRSELNLPTVDSRVIEFGESALIMTQPDEFMSRIATAARETGRSFHGDLVDYVPQNFIGDTGLFAKTEPFLFQSEWRFAMFDGPGDPITLKLGDLSDISKLIATDELSDFVEDYRAACNAADAENMA